MKPIEKLMRNGTFNVLPFNELSLFPQIGNRKFWDNVDLKISEFLLSKGRGFLNYEWPLVRATHYMTYSNTGSRTACENPHFARRTALCTLIAAECIENKGRFLNDIIDGIWVICEETTWVISAHSKGFLPEAENEDMDLFGLETAALLSYAYHLLKVPLDGISPIIRARIGSELEKRIIGPYLKHNDYWWQGFSNKTVNNWAPWCTSNVLLTFLLVCEDDAKRKAAVEKAVRTVDIFVDVYKEDGLCDEGPNYWDRAGASLMDCLELLYAATDGKINIYREPLIRKMGTYISDVRLAGKYYLNFADANAVCGADGIRIFTYGKNVGSEELMAEGSYLTNGSEVKDILGLRSAVRLFPEIKAYTEAINYGRTTDTECRKIIWFKDNQVLIARETENRCTGLIFGAKGGNNAESHNHNDVGNFIVYDDGTPLFIDLGVETYTAKTFSSRRYDIWTMRSDYHNLPTFGNITEQPGADKKAENVVFNETDGVITLSMELSKAYGGKIGRYIRNMTFDTVKSEIKINDDFDYEGDVNYNFISIIKPELDDNGIALYYADRKKCRTLKADKDVRISIEEYDITDPRMSGSWKGHVYRTIIKTDGKPVTFIIK